MDLSLYSSCIADQVPRNAFRVLDLGCGTGSLGEIIKGLRACDITGVTYDKREAEIARSTLNRVMVQDLNDESFAPQELGTFSCILCSHILEHLYHPEKLLTKLLPCLDKDGVLVAVLPNALIWQQRLRFLRGDFRYTQKGLLDKTHFRFFTWETAQELLTSSRYTIISRHPQGYCPLSRFLLLKPLQNALDRYAVHMFPGLFSWQFVFKCAPAVRQ